MISSVPQIILTPKERELFTILKNFLVHKNYNTVLRVAGGWVRDKVLGKDSHDIDLALDNMMGKDFASDFLDYVKLNVTNEQVHGFGIIKANSEKSKNLETATFNFLGLSLDFVNLRSESYSENSRVPTIKFGTPEEDAYRRDLTINALFYNINEDKIEDFTQKGIDDLKNKIIRTPIEPFKTFTDDPLRVLRCLRFASRFQFEIVPEILEAIVRPEIITVLAKKVSKERIGKEVQLSLLSETSFSFIKKAYDLNLFQVFFELPNKQVNFSDKYVESIYHCTKLKDFLQNEPIKSSSVWRFVRETPNFSESEIRYLSYLVCLTYSIHNFQVEIGKNKFCSGSEYAIRENLKLTVKESHLVSSINQAIEELKSKKYETKTDLGLFVRKFGEYWPLPLLMGCVIQNNYQFREIQLIYENKLEKAYELKPLLNGDEIKNIFSLQAPGPLIKIIGDQIILWQLNNIEASKTTLIEEIKKNPDFFKTPASKQP